MRYSHLGALPPPNPQYPSPNPADYNAPAKSGGLLSTITNWITGAGSKVVNTYAMTTQAQYDASRASIEIEKAKQKDIDTKLYLTVGVFAVVGLGLLTYSGGRR